MSGSAGVTSILLILLGGGYVFWSKTASRTIILSAAISFLVINGGFYLLGVDAFRLSGYELLYGSFWFCAFFMATDPVSAPKKEAARVIYGILIVVVGTVIRKFSVFNGGHMFGLLVANMFAPLIDYAVTSYQQQRKARTVAAEGEQ